MKAEIPSENRHTLWLIVVVMAITVAGGATAGEEEDLKWGFQPKLSLSVIVPWGNKVALQDDGGFALTFQMSAWESKILGIGVEDWPPTLPGEVQNGYLVFDDPDGCPSFIAQGFQAGIYTAIHCGGTNTEYPDCSPEEWPLNLPYACPADAPDYNTWLDGFMAADPWPFDETWVEFFSGISVPAQVPPDERETPPVVWRHVQDCVGYPAICTTSFQLVGVGPNLGSDTDFTRYGRWGRLPGLVVIADHGPGLITQPLDPNIPPYSATSPPKPTYSYFFDPPQPLRAWNLAGHFSTVGHTLQADRNAWPGWGRTTLTAQLIAPASLFKPVMLIDRVVTIPFTDELGNSCLAGDSAYRMDGGPLTCVPHSVNYLDGFTTAELITVRIFVVNGDAPDTVVDLDGNGVLDYRDVEADGGELLTRQRTVRFYQYSQQYCGVSYDFDGDHQSGSCVHGARAGGITGVPR